MGVFDFRRLNDVTTPDRYPIPHIQDFTANLSGSTISFKIELIKGYYQVPVHPDDIPKTAITTPFGLFEFLRMPFGLKNAAQAFQRLMDETLNGLFGIFVYLDDILVASNSKQEHLILLRSINLAKWEFGKLEFNFLGHKITKHGVSPLPEKVEAINRFRKPDTVKRLQEFIGMVTFYHRFVPSAAMIMQPLYTALKGTPKTLNWTKEMESAFHPPNSL